MGNLQANAVAAARPRARGRRRVGVMLGMGGISASGKGVERRLQRRRERGVLSRTKGLPDAFVGWVDANGNAGT